MPLKTSTSVAQVVGVEVEVVRGALGLLRLLERLGEVLALDVQHRGAEHLHEAAVGVPGEARVAGLGGEALDRRVVEADVEDGLHHPGHRELGAGADGHQQRVVGLAELLAHRLLERDEVLGDLVGEAGGLVAVDEVGPAGLGGDGEPGRHRQAEVRHLGEVRALPSEQVLLVLVALAERVHELGHAASGARATIMVQTIMDGPARAPTPPLWPRGRTAARPDDADDAHRAPILDSFQNRRDTAARVRADRTPTAGRPPRPGPPPRAPHEPPHQPPLTTQ